MARARTTSSSAGPGRTSSTAAAADQPADVSADGDVREDEAEGEVDHDQPHGAAAEHVGPLAFEHERSAEDAEDRSRRADRRRRWRDDERARRPGEARDEVEE